MAILLKPFALYVGLRYTRAKRRTRFISFISLVSMLGIALGVMALITVLSVMNGFDFEIRKSFFSVSSPVTINVRPPVVTRWRSLRKNVLSVPGVLAVSPFVYGKGMLMHQGSTGAVAVLGILPEEEKKTSALFRLMVRGRYDSLLAKNYHVLLGEKLASDLGVMLGDNVTLLIPQTTTSPFGLMPRLRQFKVTGIFRTHSGFGFDSGFAYVNLHDAVTLYAMSGAFGGMHVALNDVYQAPRVTQAINARLPHGDVASNWTQTSGAFFKALAMEKVMMFVLLLLVVAVAAFNLVSTLMMTVNDKRADIAILRTMGASPRTIMAIFIVQGAVLGCVGSVVGMFFGVLLSLNATRIVNALQALFHTQFISSSVYFINYLPSRLSESDVLMVMALAVGLSLLATLYPAWSASKTQPAEALRYD